MSYEQDVKTALAAANIQWVQALNEIKLPRHANFVTLFTMEIHQKRVYFCMEFYPAPCPTPSSITPLSTDELDDLQLALIQCSIKHIADSNWRIFDVDCPNLHLRNDIKVPAPHVLGELLLFRAHCFQLLDEVAQELNY